MRQRQLRRLIGPCRSGISLLLVIQFTAAIAVGDVVRLIDGGELRGTIEAKQSAKRKPGFRRKADSEKPNDENDHSPIVIRTVHGTVVQIDRADIALVVKRKPIIEEYETLSSITDPTAAEQLKLAQWCRKNRLKEQATTHFGNVVTLDPENKEAHKALDHIFRDGQWHSRAQYMEDRGLVKFKGRWITLEERDLAVKSEVQRDSERKWYRRIHTLHGWITGRHAARQQDAQKELSQLDDPNALPALSKHFQNSQNAPLREFYVSVLKKIGGPDAVSLLIKQGLYDVEKSLRKIALDSVDDEHQTQAESLLVSELRNSSNVVIRRAAAALDRFGTKSSVAPLINSLATSHRYKVRVPDTSGNMSFGSDGSFSMGGGNGVQLSPEIERGIRSGQYPFGAIVIPPNLPQRTKVVTVKVDHRNPEVLDTLRNLSGEDFGYDIRAWKLWHEASKNGTNATFALP